MFANADAWKRLCVMLRTLDMSKYDGGGGCFHQFTDVLEHFLACPQRDFET